MGLKEELTSIKTTISDGVVANKVSKFAYTDTAYNENDVDGVATYDVTKEQNIPLGTPSVMKVNETVVTKGWRARASSITRMLMNHFLGRISYNLNKANDMINSILSNIISYLGTANGIATLDTDGRIPYAQLPDSMVTLKGYWNASTNTPTLADGTGTNGDEYIVDVAGSQDLGSGSQYFKVGDRVVYSSSVWRNIDSGSVKSVCNVTPDQAGNVSLAKGDVGLGNVVDTGDSATPVAGGDTKFTTGGAYTELAKKVDKTTTVNGHALSSNVTVTKSDVGLGNVVNTGDSDTPAQGGTDKFTTGGAYADKLATPTQNSTKNFTAGGAYADKLATPTQNSTKNFTAGGAYTELAKKVNTTTTVNGHALDGNVTVTKSDVGLGNVANTGDSAIPVSVGTTKFTTGGAYRFFDRNDDYDMWLTEVFSRDLGIHWSKAGLTYGVDCIQSDGHTWIAVSGNTIYRSTSPLKSNGWSAVTGGQGVGEGRCIVYANNIWVVCCASGVYKSSDGGYVFTRVSTVAMSQCVYVNSAWYGIGDFSTGGVYTATLSASSWSSISSFSTAKFEVVDVIYDSTEQKDTVVVYGADSSGGSLWYNKNGVWTNIPASSTGSAVTALIYTGSVYVVNTFNNGLYKSETLVTTSWTAVSISGTSATAGRGGGSLSYSPEGGAVGYVRGVGIVRSDDGTAWSLVPRVDGLIDTYADNWRVLSFAGGTWLAKHVVYITTTMFTTTLYYSKDRGHTWNKCSVSSLIIPSGWTPYSMVCAKGLRAMPTNDGLFVSVYNS